MEGRKHLTTSTNGNEKLQLCDATREGDVVKYRSMVGGLLYLTHTRPDLIYAVSLVSRFMCQPTMQHHGAIKWILRYVAGTQSLGVHYTHREVFNLVDYTDSDGARSVDDWRRTFDFIFKLGSSVITCESKKQNSTALSSTEAEYVIVAGAACQAVWLRRLLEEFGMMSTDPTLILCDNSSAIFIAKHPTMHGKTKHMDIKYHFLRDLVTNGTIRLEYCSTKV